MSENKVNYTSTKSEIWKAFKANEEELNKLKAQNQTSAQKAVAENKKVQAVEAKEIIEMGILSDEIKNKYNSLKNTMTDMESELKSMYGIQVKANTLEALVNTHNTICVDLNKKYDAMRAELEEEYRNSLKNHDEEIATLQKDIKVKKETLTKEYNQHKEEIDLKRKREEEEYQYNLKIKKRNENDAWEKEKEERESELSVRENAVAVREEKMNSLEVKVITMTDDMEKMKEQHAQELQDSYNKGKKDADDSHKKSQVFIERENKLIKEKFEDKIADLEAKLAEEKQRSIELSTKLESAYMQIREIATKTVEANGSVKIVESQKN